MDINLTGGTFDLADPAAWDGLTLTNTSGTKTATVTITAPDGRTIYTAQLGRGGSVRLSGLNVTDLPAGVYRIAVTGTVTGSLGTSGLPPSS